MGLRFRKSIKIGKHASVNIGKKGVGLSVGTKGARVSVNSSGRKTTTVGIPETGLSYTSTTTKKKSNSSKSKQSRSNSNVTDSRTSAPTEHKPQTFYSSAQYVALSTLHLIGGIISAIACVFLHDDPSGWGNLLLLLSAYLLIKGIVYRIKSKNAGEKNAFLLEWQNALLHQESNELFMSKEWLTEETNFQVANDLRIIADSNKIIGETVSPDTFFSRLDVIIEHTARIESIRKYSEIADSPAVEIQIDAETKKFIDRYCDDVIGKAAGLKTDKGKQNRYKKAVGALSPYYSRISKESLSFVENNLGVAVEKPEENTI